MAEPFCTFGGQAKVASPEYFQFEATDIVTFFPYLAGQISLWAMDIPTGVQNTATFCSAGPPADLPNEADIFALAMPPLAIAGGSLHRLGNFIKASKWSELCECRDSVLAYAFPQWVVVSMLGGSSAPAAEAVLNIVVDVVPVTGGPSHAVAFPGIVARRVAGSGNVVGWVSGRILGNVTHLHFERVSRSSPTLSLQVYLVDAPFVVGPRDVDQGMDFQQWAVSGVGASPTDTSVTAPSPRATPVYTLPSPVGEPDGYPAGGGDSPCADATLEDLCKQLAAMAAKVDYLVNETAPPQIVPADEPIPAIPSDPAIPPGTPDVPLAPIPKPVGAIGVIVQFTAVPPSKARYGGDPLYYPDLAHVILMTASGPLPGLRVTRNPEVILNIDNEVVSLVLDPSPGVVGQVQWLMGYQ